MRKRVGMRAVTTLGIAAAALTLTGAAVAMQFSAWATAQKIDEVGGNHADLNTPSLDGCRSSHPTA